MKVKSESEVTQSCLTLSDPWTAAYQAPPSMRLSEFLCKSVTLLFLKDKLNTTLPII